MALSPRLKRYLIIGAALGGLMGVIGFTSWLQTDPQSQRIRESAIANVVTSSDTRQPTIEGLSAQLDAARRENATLKGAQQRLEQRLTQTIDKFATALQRDIANDRSRSVAEREAAIADLQSQIATLRADDGTVSPAEDLVAPGLQVSDEDRDGGRTVPSALPERAALEALPPMTVPDRPESPPDHDPGVSLTDTDTGIVETAFPSPRSLPPFPPHEGAQRIPDDLWTRDWAPAPAAVGADNTASTPAQPAGGTFRVIRAERPAVEPVEEVVNPPFRLPAGSILSGTLITGLDAHTSAQARREPFPVLLRLKHHAILPNRYHADVRECFLLMAAHGDIMSERAYLRGENLSCVLSDGEVVESKLQGYAAGEDGKAGARGRLVTKQGQFIARALAIAFMEAGANALSSNTRQINVGITSGTDGGNIPGALAVGAAGNALDRIADWYIQQALNIFPVIEIDAGRQLDIVLTQSLTIPLPNA